VRFGGSVLFEDVNFNISKNERIGLIGRNGTGKSTILKLLAGLNDAQEGSITKPNDYTIGYLPQEGTNFSDKTVWEETKSALIELGELESEIHHISEELSARNDYHTEDYTFLIQKLNDLNDRANIIGKGTADAEIEKVLSGLGFTREDFYRYVDEFSGGWQMRIELAKILLRRPDLILLDEPTNHLDIESIRWLELFLKDYKGSIMIVSHDSRFLDSVCNRTMEITLGKLYDLQLSYNKFIEVREMQRQHQMSVFKNQQRKIAETERFIERFRAKATLASRVQSRIKQLEKIEVIEVEEEDFTSIHFHFPEPPRSGRVAVEMENLTKSYGDKLVLDKIHFAVERGEKVAFLGKNGEGKSTLSKIIAGIESYEGELKLGHNVSLGYFAQHQAEMLDGDATVLETIDNAATGDIRTQIRSLLGAFLFSGDSVYKKVKVLSGGEKSRLALAKLLLAPTNLIVMDEPTNHLDMMAKSVLKKALSNYSGSLIIVSHDRDFLKGLTTKSIEFRNQGIKEYPGDIEEFLSKQQIVSLDEVQSAQPTEPEEEKPEPIKQAKLDREKQKAIQREENKVKRLINQCENEIHELETKISDYDSFFASPEYYNNPEKYPQKSEEYALLRKSLETRMNEWEQLNLQLEAIK